MLIAQRLQRLQVGPIDLEVEASTCVCITGPSGAGKSVLLRMIADLDPHEGDVFLDGVACSATPAPDWRRQVMYVAAESGWWLTEVGAHFPEDTDFSFLLPMLGLAREAASWPVARLSSGERQRLALLRAIARKPRVLLLDEPTSGLDSDSARRVEAMLLDRIANGVGILMVTHDSEQARRMGTHHLRLAGGRVEVVA